MGRGGKCLCFLRFTSRVHTGMGTSSLQKDRKGIKVIVIAFSKLKPQWSILMKGRMQNIQTIEDSWKKNSFTNLSSFSPKLPDDIPLTKTSSFCQLKILCFPELELVTRHCIYQLLLPPSVLNLCNLFLKPFKHVVSKASCINEILNLFCIRN